MTAHENAESVLALQGTPKAERRERVMSLLREVGVEGLEHRRPTSSPAASSSASPSPAARRCPRGGVATDVAKRQGA